MKKSIATLLFVSLFAEAKIFEICTSEYPPFEYMKDGKVTGMDVEKVRAVFRAMGEEVEIFIAPWKRCEMMAEAGAVAGIMSMTYSEKRGEASYFSKPISSVKDVFFKRESDKIEWNKLQELKNYKIGVSGGYSYDKSFEEAKKKGLFSVVEDVSSGTPEYQNLKKLALKRIDLFICEVNTCSYIIKMHQNELGGIDFVDKPVGEIRTFHVGFSKKYPESGELLERFNKALDGL